MFEQSGKKEYGIKLAKEKTFVLFWFLTHQNLESPHISTNGHKK